MGPSSRFQRLGKPVFAPKVSLVEFEKALDVCRDEIPPSFLEEFHSRISLYSQDERNKWLEMVLKGRWPECASKARGIKLMSYFGAVRAHEDICLFGVYDSSLQAYYDPGNEVYSWVLANVWPEALPFMSPEKRGDVVEALLGMCWFMSHPEKSLRNPASPLALDVYAAVDLVIRYIHDNWDVRDIRQHDVMMCYRARCTSLSL